MTAAAERVVMISGGNRGIGRAIALRLAKDGYRLSLGQRRPTAAPAANPAGTLVHAYDAASPTDADGWVAATVARFGRLDAVVANAGIYHDVDVETGGETELDAMWQVNAKGPWRLVRAAYPHLKASGRGRVVVIASMSGLRVKSASHTGYSMSKFAAVALVQGLRHSGWKHGIRATAICPGYVATDMTADVAEPPAADMTQPESIADLAAAAIALPNAGVPPVIAVNCLLEP